jgi:Predicted transcriptional regulators
MSVINDLTASECRRQLMGVYDALDVLKGKWKVYILANLIYYEKRKFSDILKGVDRISNKMLSKELKEMEMNHLVKRTVMETQPITVQYELTKLGRSLGTVITSLSEWGLCYREEVFKVNKETESVKP